MIRTLVTGYGYWGRIVTQRLLQHPEFFVAGIHDPSHTARADAQRFNLHTYRTLEDAINREAPELVCVCTPVSQIPEASAYASTRYAHVMAAKPGATTPLLARRMMRAAAAKQRALVVDYTLTAAPKWHRVRELVPTLGDIKRIDCVRTTTMNRSSVDVLDDLAVHDLSLIVDAVDDAEWRVMVARGNRLRRELTLRAGECSAFVTVMRHAGGVERAFRVVGSQGALTWDQARDTLICTTDGATTMVGADMVDAVTARLWLLARVIRENAPDNQATFEHVTRLLDEARSYEETSHAA